MNRQAEQGCMCLQGNKPLSTSQKRIVASQCCIMILLQKNIGMCLFLAGWIALRRHDITVKEGIKSQSPTQSLKHGKINVVTQTSTS